MKTVTAIGPLALLASLGACGSADQPTANPSAGAAMTMDGPFAKSEMDMDAAMKNAIGVDAADTWVKKMIAHHQGAIDMSRIVLGLRPTPDVARMAEMTIAHQGAEIAALEALSRRGSPNAESAALYEAAMVTMHDDMMRATGADASATYLAKMLAHHRGAVAMSDIALANGATGAVRAQIEETRAEQLREVAMVEAMQRGEPMRMPAATPGGAASQAASEPAAAATTAARPAPAKPASPKPAAAKAGPSPAAEPAATPSCAPEHRAAGHC